MGSGYSVEHMQTFVNVVTGREWKMLGIPFAAGTEAPFSSVMGKQRCRRIESTYPIVSPQRNRVSPYRSPQGEDQPQGGSIAVRVRDRRGSQCRSVMERISVASGHIDNITERESVLTSLWCCTRENLTNQLMGESR